MRQPKFKFGEGVKLEALFILDGNSAFKTRGELLGTVAGVTFDPMLAGNGTPLYQYKIHIGEGIYINRLEHHLEAAGVAGDQQ